VGHAPYQPTPHMPAHAVSVYRAAPAAPPDNGERDERMVRFYPAWPESRETVQRTMAERPRGFRVSA
jgi:hypothetical protein